MSESPENEDKNPFHRAASLADLLSFHDLDFVRCAYVTLLGRQPDGPGQSHFLQEVRAGTSKLDVLWRLRRSPEAKAHDPGIAGLDRALNRAAWERRPLLGALPRFLRDNSDSNSRTDRALRSLQNAVSINQRYLDAITSQLRLHASLSGLPTYPQAPTTPRGGSGERLSEAERGSLESTSSPAQTPELNHLRAGGVAQRYIGHVAP